ncbi:MAG: hypothetical protein ACREQL_02465 [Candidatus Binatia bacterium]
MPRLVSCALFALVLPVALFSPAVAAERTFLFTAADILNMVDEFNAAVLAHSAALGGAARIRGGAVALAGRRCPSLMVHPERRATRLRVLDGPARAAALAAHPPSKKLLAALEAMGATAWSPPGRGRTRRTSWTTEPTDPGITGFATIGYANGDPTGGISAVASADIDASFLVSVDLTTSPGTAPADLVLAMTTELPPTAAGRRPKRTECYLLATSETVDLAALVDLLAAAPIMEPTRTQLGTILSEVGNWLAKRRPDRAALLAKRFAIRVARLSATDVPPDAAEALVTRAIKVSDALDF